MGLPFLVVYGAWVWKVVLVACTAGLLGLGYLRRKRAVRGAYELVVAPLRTELTEPRSGAVTLLAKVVDDTTLRCDAAELELEGERTIAFGSSAIVRRTPEPEVRPVVKPGDTVLVTGTLRQLPPEHASYREGTPRWIVANPTLYATAPAIRPTPLAVPQLLGRVVVAGLGVFLAMYLAGAILEPRESDSPDRNDQPLRAIGRYQIAAALPGSRAKALDRIGYELSRQAVTTKAGFDNAVELEQLRGRCPIAIFRSFADYEGGLATAKRCGTPDQQAEMLFMLGRFADAQAVVTNNADADLAIQIALANGNWKHAADLVEVFDTNDVPHHQIHYTDEESIATRHCFAAMLRTWAGEPHAFDHIARGKDATCDIIEAASKPVEQQAAAWAAVRIPHQDAGIDSARYDLLAPQLARAAGTQLEGRMYAISNGASALMFDNEAAYVYLAPQSKDPVDQVAFDVLRGDLAAAHAELARLPAGWQTDELALGLAIREGTPLPDAKPQSPMVYDAATALARGEFDRVVKLSSPSEVDARVVKRAAAGEGAALVELIGAWGRYFDMSVHTAMVMLPMLKTDQAAVREALHYYRDGDTLGRYDLREVWAACAYRDLARLAGETAAQKHWQDVVDRWFAMLADRQRLIALLLWS